jgi:hypothetical protein
MQTACHMAARSGHRPSVRVMGLASLPPGTNDDRSIPDALVPAAARSPHFEFLPPERTADRTWRWRLESGTGEIRA